MGPGLCQDGGGGRSLLSRALGHSPGLIRIAAGITRRLLDITLTPCCTACGQLLSGVPESGLSLCDACVTTVQRISHPLCPVCGNPCQAAGPHDVTCGDCSRSPPHFHRARASFAYAGAMVRLVMQLKYARHFDQAPPLGRIMGAVAAVEELDDVDLIVPVPLAVPRFVRRGYNQAALLGRATASILGRPMKAGILRRVRDLGPQGRHGPRERAARVRGCFSVIDEGMVQNRRVLLVDDVLTTGATASECARVLTRAGAVRVDVMACARAIRDSG